MSADMPEGGGGHVEAKQKTLNHWVVGSIPTRCIPKNEALTWQIPEAS